MYMSVKAGAQPAMHMAMPICALSTRSIRLIGANSRSKVSVCASVSVLAISVTSTPLPTAIGVFGMVHWTCASTKSVPNSSRNLFRFQPAAMDTTILPGSASSFAIGPMTLSIWYGLIAMTITSAASATSAAVCNGRAPSLAVVLSSLS